MLRFDSPNERSIEFQSDGFHLGETERCLGPDLKTINKLVNSVWILVRGSNSAKLTVGLFIWTILRLISVIHPIRIGYLHANSLGGFITQTDLAFYLNQISSARNHRRGKNLFVMPSDWANTFVTEQYRSMISRRNDSALLESPIPVIQKVLEFAALGMEQMAIQVPRSREYYCGSPTREGLDACGFVQDGRPLIKISGSNVDDGWRALATLGLDPTQKIVCFNGRDSEYWKLASGKSIFGGGGRTQDFRNVNIENYLPGLEYLVNRGFTVIRMGHTSHASTELSSIGVVDYASSKVRSDVLDVLLFEHCQAAVFGGASGIAQLALAFHKPVCVFDYRPFIFTEWSTPICMVVPSLMQDSASGKILTLQQMLQHPYNLGAMYNEKKLAFIDNSSMDISDTVHEFTALLESPKSPHSPSDLQEKFWQVVNDYRPNYVFYPRPGDRAVRISSRFDLTQLQVTPRRTQVSETFLQKYAPTLFEKQFPVPSQ